ncbi:MAG: type II toxin-antitoxin system RelE/ParE family toxin [Planctomycetota bacterium]
MRASYRLTSTAERDIAEILRFVADRDGVDRALHVHERLVRLFEELVALPDSGLRRPELV